MNSESMKQLLKLQNSEFFVVFALVIHPLTTKNRPCALISACALNRKTTVMIRFSQTQLFIGCIFTVKICILIVFHQVLEHFALKQSIYGRPLLRECSIKLILSKHSLLKLVRLFCDRWHCQRRRLR